MVTAVIHSLGKLEALFRYMEFVMYTEELFIVVTVVNNIYKLYRVFRYFGDL